MTYTSHGHHIPGTIKTVNPPAMGVKRCGGPAFCDTCAADAYKQLSLKDVLSTEDYISAEKETKAVKTKVFQRKPFEVEAVQVTEENFDEIAAWCGGAIVTEQETKDALVETPPRRYISVDVARPLSRRQTEAHVGDWILYASKGFKVYSNRPFLKNFEEKPLPGTVSYERIVSHG
jgi:hypothetical protein